MINALRKISLIKPLLSNKKIEGRNSRKSKMSTLEINEGLKSKQKINYAKEQPSESSFNSSQIPS